MLHSELRKGNYIKDDRGVVRDIKSVGVDYTMSGAFPIVRTSIGCHDLSYVDPIELTEEWLTKLGFDKKIQWKAKSGYDFVRNSCSSCVKYVNRDSQYIFSCIVGAQEESFFIKYVHELQNLHRELTGEELTIKEGH